MDPLVPLVVLGYRKRAGLMEYPSGLFDLILDWVESVWDSTRELLNRGKPATKRKKFIVTPSILKDWKYYKDLESRYPEIVHKSEPELVVILKVTKSGMSSGSCKGTYELTLSVSPYTSIDSVGDTLTHELTHWGQNYMSNILSRALGRQVNPGLPPRKLLDEGIKQNPQKKKYLESHKLHKLDDREFYPLLRSEIEKFESRFDDLIAKAEAYWENPEENGEWYASSVIDARELAPNLNDLLRYYVLLDRSSKPGVPSHLYRSFTPLGDTIFAVAFMYNPEKWKKAVGTFFNAMAPYLRDSTWAKAIGDKSIEPI